MSGDKKCMSEFTSANLSTRALGSCDFVETECCTESMAKKRRGAEAAATRMSLRARNIPKWGGAKVLRMQQKRREEGGEVGGDLHLKGAGVGL